MTQPHTKPKLKILAVEDNASDVQMIQFMFDRMHQEVEILHFETGEAAMAHISQLPENPPEGTLPHVIFLDLKLPGESGVGILKKIKAIPAFLQIPVIINTSSTGKDDLVQTYKYGATFFMPKHYEIDILQDVITQLKISGRIKL